MSGNVPCQKLGDATQSLFAISFEPQFDMCSILYRRGLSWNFSIQEKVKVGNKPAMPVVGMPPRTVIAGICFT
jgi:hypothetical protein